MRGKENLMYIVVVHSHIQEEQVERFRELTIQNAEATRGEEGCVRFDVLQQADDETRFTFCLTVDLLQKSLEFKVVK
jgi:quinol monooxygenase YgiN